MLEVQKMLRSMPFEEAKAQLDNLGIDYHIEKEYLHLDYGIKADKYSNIVKECRGLVLKMGSFDIQRFAFYRFMNYGETGADQFDESKPVSFQEKLDGSLIIFSYFEDIGWIPGTRGRVFPDAKINGYEMNFQDLFWNILFSKGKFNVDERFDRNNCYVFELTSPINQVVVPHTDSNLTILTIRDKDWNEWSNEDVCEWAYYMDNINVPKDYVFKNLLECVLASKNLTGMFEGFVAKQWNGERYARVKIKTDAYLNLHHVVTSKSLGNMVKIVFSGNSSILEQYPQFMEIYNQIDAKLNVVSSEIEEKFRDIFEKAKDIQDAREKRKTFASLIDMRYCGIYFCLYDQKISDVKKYICSQTDKKAVRRWIEVLEINKIVDSSWNLIEKEEEDY